MRGIEEIHNYVLEQNQLAEAQAITKSLPDEDTEPLVTETGSAEIDMSDVKHEEIESTEEVSADGE